MAKDFKKGDTVWAKMKGYPFWPGIITDPLKEMKTPSKVNFRCVYFFGTKNYSWIDIANLKDYTSNKLEFGNSSKTSLKLAVDDIEEFLKRGDSKLFTKEDPFDQLVGVSKTSTPKRGTKRKNSTGDTDEGLPLAKKIKKESKEIKKKMTKETKKKDQGTKMKKKEAKQLKKKKETQVVKKEVKDEKKEEAKDEKKEEAKDVKKKKETKDVKKKKDKKEKKKKGTKVVKENKPLKGKKKKQIKGKEIKESKGKEEKGAKKKGKKEIKEKKKKDTTEKEKKVTKENEKKETKIKKKKETKDMKKKTKKIKGKKETKRLKRKKDKKDVKKRKQRKDKLKKISGRKKFRLSKSKLTSIKKKLKKRALARKSISPLPTIGFRNTYSYLSRPSPGKAEVEPVDLTKFSEELMGKKIKPSSLIFGFIGLGVKGSRILKNIVQSRHSVIIWNRTPKKCEPFENIGIQVASTPYDVASASDIIFLCVGSNEASIIDILFGSNLSLAIKSGGKSFVNLSNISDEISTHITDFMEAFRCRYLEVRTMGTVQEADKGLLNVFAAGDKSLFDDSESCLRAFSEEFNYLGESIKELNGLHFIQNSMMAIASKSLTQCLRLVKRSGNSVSQFFGSLLISHFQDEAFVTKYMSDAKEGISLDLVREIELFHASLRNLTVNHEENRSLHVACFDPCF